MSQETHLPPLPSHRLRLWPWLVTLVLIAVGVWVGVRLYLERKANWGVVIPGQIYRSAQVPRSLILSKLKDHDIRAMVVLLNDVDKEPEFIAERDLCRELGIEYHNFPMRGDGLAAPEMYTRALEAVCNAKKQGKPVLIHCHAGAQRTGGVVAVYRVLVEGKSPAEAVKEMKHYGHNPKKNPALIPFLNEHLARWAEDLARLGLIERVPSPLPRFEP